MWKSCLLPLVVVALVAPGTAKPVRLECQFEATTEGGELGAPFRYILDTSSNQGTGRMDGGAAEPVQVRWNDDDSVTIVDESTSTKEGVRKRIRDEVTIHAKTGKATGLLVIQEPGKTTRIPAEGVCGIF